MELAIKQKVDSIAECVFARIQDTQEKSYGLYSGEFGQLLFLLYYSKFSKNNGHVLLTDNYAEQLMQQFVEREKMHTFCSGFSGILYLFEFLRKNQIINLDAGNVQPFLDNYIVSKMRWDMRNRHFDFMHCALGVGLYFLKRKTNPEYIQQLIDFLYHTAEKDASNRIFKWESVVDYEKKLPGYNLALSHGISSIIIFLSRVVKSGMYNEKISETLTGAVNYVISQQKNFSELGYFFPSFVFKNLPNPASKSRLAWCYGDLGPGVALWQAGIALKNTEWQEKALEILLQSTQRRAFNETFTSDAGICHGSAGIVMIFRRMFFETKRSEFNDAVNYWIKQTLNFSRFEDGLAGYKTMEKEGWKCDYSLLSGITGIGLVLLSYLVDDEQDWDELFLLS